MMLLPGVKLETPEGTKFQIKERLGGGAQGEVYLARLSGDHFVAVKWYKPDHATTAQRRILENLISVGAPQGGRFLWPLHIVNAVDGGTPQFGFVMERRPDGFNGLTPLLNRALAKEFAIGLRSLAKLGFDLADQFQLLHSLGLCYRDISLDNVWYNAKTREVLIADCDNIAKADTPGILIGGTKKFIAPEVITRQAAFSAQTDLYSLAVLLFYVLINQHPLDGQLEADLTYPTDESDQRLYIDNPVFIFDPYNDSNRPNPESHENALIFWAMYPQFIRDQFTKAFTHGLIDPANGRVTTPEWRRDMTRLSESIVICSHRGCGKDNVFNPFDEYWRSGARCWRCKQQLNRPFWLKLRHPDHDRCIVLQLGVKILRHQIQTGVGYDDTLADGEVTHRPGHPHILGITNHSQTVWISSLNGIEKPIEPGGTVQIAKGLRIRFNTGMEGEVQA